MTDEKSGNLAAGILAGAIGGLVASWMMNLFIEDAGPKLQKVVEGMNGQQTGHEGSQPEDEGPKEDATMKTADAVVSTVTGGRHLSFEEKQKGGPIVHYAFGAVMGGLYGALAEYSPAARAGFGTAFAGLLFAGADMIAVPALHLSPATGDQPASSMATPFGAHMVYGVTTECVRRLVRAAI
jgi:putative membrane protein